MFKIKNVYMDKDVFECENCGKVMENEESMYFHEVWCSREERK
jgi:DNA replicative helicase MCM subunit Mcm2 (Cdc46/Mcm family)